MSRTFEHLDIQPVAEPGTGFVAKGDPVNRVDGRAKVLGLARYAAEHMAPDLAYGVVVSSRIARGRIAAIDTAAALAVPGVLAVLSHLNRPKVRKLDLFYKDMTAPGGSPFKPLHGDAVFYSGQPVALVLAETFEAARHAASLVHVDYEAAPHQTNLLRHLARAHQPSRLKAGFSPPPKPTGDADAAYATAPVKVDTFFYSGVEHHNPMEMHATTVLRDTDGHLTIYDKTQSPHNSRWLVSHVFGLSKNKVTVKNPFVGGAFGSGLRPQYNLILAVMASLQLQRSVRVVLTRQQMFTFGHRPETWQRVRLAAAHDGSLSAVLHEAVAETSRLEDYVEVVVNWSGQLYRCASTRLGYRLVDLDHASPMDMRAPGAAHGVYALEVAMDELSYALRMDPLALRLVNYATEDQGGTPYSTKELRACYEQGAARFGWDRRPLQPRAMREVNELVGWGMATGQWDAMQMFARAEAVLSADGKLVVRSAATDIGTGTYTVMAQIAAHALGLPLEDVTFVLGDSRLPVAPIEGGSSHVATVGSAVEGVCVKLQKRLVKIARASGRSGWARVRHADVEFSRGALRVRADPSIAWPLTELMAASGQQCLQDKYLLLPNVLKQKKYIRATHSAVFCEVRVDEAFGTVRVTRVVSAIAAGRIMNTKTARSQILGGVVWGISQALHEETHADHTLGRFMNHNFAEYHVAANADIHDIDVIFVEEDDRVVSRLGAKGVGRSVSWDGRGDQQCHLPRNGPARAFHPQAPDKVMQPSDEWPAGDAVIGINAEVGPTALAAGAKCSGCPRTCERGVHAPHPPFFPRDGECQQLECE